MEGNCGMEGVLRGPMEAWPPKDGPGSSRAVLGGSIGGDQDSLGDVMERPSVNDLVTLPIRVSGCGGVSRGRLSAPLPHS